MSCFHDFQIPDGVIIAETLLRIFDQKELNDTIRHTANDPVMLINALLGQIDLRYEIPSEDLRNIPKEGPFITVSNHPYRGVDSMLLYKIISEKRNDFKIMASYLLHKVGPLENIIIPVNTYETSVKSSGSLNGIREAYNHLKDGYCLGIFPAGEESAHMEISRVILDKKWQVQAIKMIRKATVPVIPVYFHGTRSKISHIVSKIHPVIRFRELPTELTNRKNRTVKIRIGSPVSIEEQNKFKDISMYGRYLRARTYSLGSSLEARKFYPGLNIIRKKPAPVIEPADTSVLEQEFLNVRTEFELFAGSNYSVICAPTHRIPNIFYEIGRLRELTFRQVGEGTNKSTDIDEYDFYFNHLFIWDMQKSRIIGAYRIGKGKEIISLYGIKGFYINSLFRIKSGFSDILESSLELGRSFVIEEYQKRPFSLFLLWKGIMMFLLKHPEYRYLIGPVSISNEYSRFSKSLIVSFLKKYFTDETLSVFIEPRTEFRIIQDKVADSTIFIDVAERDISRIEKIIMDVEPGYRLPILLKKYLEINGRIIGFNIDPDFNFCLDGLILLDLYKTPPEFIRGLSREMKDSSIMERFIQP